MTTVTSADIEKALMVYSIVHLVTAAALRTLKLIKTYFYTQYHHELHAIIKNRHHDTNDDDSIITSIV